MNAPLAKRPRHSDDFDAAPAAQTSNRSSFYDNVPRTSMNRVPSGSSSAMPAPGLPSHLTTSANGVNGSSSNTSPHLSAARRPNPATASGAQSLSQLRRGRQRGDGTPSYPPPLRKVGLLEAGVVALRPVVEVEVGALPQLLLVLIMTATPTATPPTMPNQTPLPTLSPSNAASASVCSATRSPLSPPTPNSATSSCPTSRDRHPGHDLRNLDRTGQKTSVPPSPVFDVRDATPPLAETTARRRAIWMI